MRNFIFTVQELRHVIGKRFEFHDLTQVSYTNSQIRHQIRYISWGLLLQYYMSP